MLLKTILVTGETGQLGRSLQKIENNYSQYKFTFANRKAIDLSSSVSIRNYFKDNTFDYVVNAAAYTAVDKAESELKLADQINHLAVKQLAEICKDKRMILVHISTDYVFNGQSCNPYIETDETDPLNVYGKTKLDGERAMLAINPNGIIVRTSWVYSEFGKNFVKTMLRLGKEKDALSIVSDQFGGPTYAGDIARIIIEIIKKIEVGEKVNWGVYHYSGTPSVSWFEFAHNVFENAKEKKLLEYIPKLTAIATKEFPTLAMRPENSRLNCQAIEDEFGVLPSNWQSELDNIKNYT